MKPELIKLLENLVDKVKLRVLTGKEAMLILYAVAEMIRDGSAFIKE
jgi:hypothetical protein